MPIESDRISRSLVRIEELNDDDLRELCYENGVEEFRSLGDRCRALHERLHEIANEVEEL